MLEKYENMIKNTWTGYLYLFGNLNFFPKKIKFWKNNFCRIDELEAQVQLTQEELREFENDIELIAGEDDRYRDYKNKERQFDEFLNSFESKKVEIGSNLAQKQAKTLSLLRSISANCQRDELAAQVTGLDQSAVNMAMNNSANPGELRECKLNIYLFIFFNCRIYWFNCIYRKTCIWCHSNF